MANYDEIIQKMTLHEKVMLCTGKNSWRTKDYPHHHIPSILMSDGTSGVRFQKGSDGDGAVSISGADSFYESLSGRFDDDDAMERTYEATAFPSGSAISCSWNKELIREIGSAIAKECQKLGINLLLGPGLNTRRHPLTARNFEYYSEDPCLAGDMAAAIVKGVQGEGVGTCMKHYACHNSDTRRTRVNVRVSERALREIYLAPYERVVKKAEPTCIMTAYNKINGEECSGDTRLIKDILKKEWGFDGMVVCDWGAVKDSVEASRGGLDLQMPMSLSSAKYLEQAVLDGKLPESYIDERVRRILKTVFKLKAWEVKRDEVDFKAHHELARKAAAESMVLLKNEENILPLDVSRFKKAAVVGLLAKEPVYQGTGCAIVRAQSVDIPYECMERTFGGEISLSYAKGYEADGTTNEALLEEAAKAAKEADVIIVMAGTFLPGEDDDYNRKDMSLPLGHRACIEKMASLHKKLVVVLANGDVCEMDWAKRADAVLDIWYSGEGMGQALADILSGKENPSGKLSATVPQKLTDTPAYLGFDGNIYEIPYNEDIYVGYRYYDKKEIEPLYPFGFGLSYTAFEYSRLRTKVYEDADTLSVKISVDITNKGGRDGKECVQLYVSPKEKTRLPRPVRELKGFEKVALKAGETKTVDFVLDGRDFAYYDADLRRWVTENGIYMVEAAASSRDIRLSVPVEIKAQKPPVRLLKPDCGFHEIFETETGKTMLFDFLVEKGLLKREQINDKVEASLRWAFWPAKNFLDMGASGAVSYEEWEEFLKKTNEALAELSLEQKKRK